MSTDAHTEYLVDDASLVLVPEDPDWKAKANARIEIYRKADITVRSVTSIIYVFMNKLAMFYKINEF